MAKCKYCIEKEKNWSKWSDPIECAFENWVFSSDNWNCWTMDYLRSMAERNEVWNEDMYASVIPLSFPYDTNEYWGYLYLEWYKSRWRTDKCVDMEEMKPLTLERAYSIINPLWNKKP